MKPTYFIDLEASGIAPESYPIEVDVVFPGGEYQALIQPASYWDHWSYDAQDMHNLSREQLILEGTPPLAVAQAMNRLFDGKILCSDNPADCYWLDVLYEAAGVEPTFGVRPLETFIGREPATKALALRPAFRDHALGDVRALEACVSHYLQEGSRSLEE